MHTLGKSAFPRALAPAIMWLKLCCFWVATIKGVRDSGVKPLKASPSATSTRATSLALLICSATGPHLVPATRTVMSPPIFLAAVRAFWEMGLITSLLCSAMTKVDSNLCKIDEI